MSMEQSDYHDEIPAIAALPLQGTTTTAVSSSSSSHSLASSALSLSSSSSSSLSSSLSLSSSSSSMFSGHGQNALYVGDLDPNVVESELYEIFSRVGKVVSVRVCRDVTTKRSLGYGYVNYRSPKEASDAIQLLKFSRINGKELRIMYANPDSSVQKSGTWNVCVKNLDASVDNKTLYDEFSVYGSIISCTVATTAMGESKGYGFVQFEDEAVAKNVIDRSSNGNMIIHGRQVSVSPFVRKDGHGDLLNNDTLKFNNVYVKNFTEATTDEDLHRIFGEFGPITSAAVMRDSNGNSKCFGFVNFENADDASNAVQMLNGKTINEKEWYVSRAQKKSEREAELKGKYEQVLRERVDSHRDANLYVKNIDESIGETTLMDLFSQYGSVKSCKIMKFSDGKSKGIGFVTFSLPREAKKAVRETNGKMVGSKKLHVAIAQHKEERKARLQIENPMINLLPNHPPLFHPRSPMLGHQVFYSQPYPNLIISQVNGFGYQQPILPALGPRQMPNFFVPIQSHGFVRGAANLQPQQRLPVVQPQMQAPHSRNKLMHFSQSPRNHLLGSSLPNAQTSGAPSSLVSSPSRETTKTTPDQQRMVIGEQLYRLVEKFEHNRAGKVTGMLLELDESEILHLIKSQTALKEKVSEAMEVLRLAQVAGSH